jgi:hypothetical protein
MQSRTRPLPASATHKGGFKQTTQNHSCMCTFPLPIPIHPSQEEPHKQPARKEISKQKKTQKMPSSPTSPGGCHPLGIRKPWRKGREREEVGRVPATRTRKAAARLGLKTKIRRPKRRFCYAGVAQSTAEEEGAVAIAQEFVKVAPPTRNLFPN